MTKLFWRAIHALVKNGGEVKAAAEELGVSRPTLTEYMKDREFKRCLKLACEVQERVELAKLEAELKANGQPARV